MQDGILDQHILSNSKRFVDEGLKIFTGNPFFDIVFKDFFMFFPICSVCMLCVLSMKHN